ncbi:MAG: adenylate kinase, partial [Oscillospiraceae bacterium]|nr:adenylate kinase [Oscillospiraceae bacterium]
YIRSHFDDIRNYASVIEQRLDDSDCTMEFVLQENAQTLDMCKKYNANYLLIDDEYNVDFEL